MLSGLVAAIVAAALAAVPADRLLAAAARRRVAARVQVICGAASAPVIRLSGPFLPQLLAGRYREVQVRIGTCAVGGIGLAGLTAHLTEVRAPLRGLIASRPAPVLAGKLSAVAVIGLADLSARLPSGLQVRPHGQDLRITGNYRRVPVRGTLAVKAGRDQITVTPKLTGVGAPVGFVIGLPGLPPQLAIVALRVTGDGIEVTVHGIGVVLANQEIAA